MAALIPIGIGAATAAAPYVGEFAGKGIRKLGNLLGFKKGGSLNPKGMQKALKNATVKKTGVRVVKKNQLVIPAKLAKQIKKVAKRKPQPVKRHRKKKVVAMHKIL